MPAGLLSASCHVDSAAAAGLRSPIIPKGAQAAGNEEGSEDEEEAEPEISGRGGDTDGSEILAPLAPSAPPAFLPGLPREQSFAMASYWESVILDQIFA